MNFDEFSLIRARQTCRESASSSNKLLLALCQRACAAGAGNSEVVNNNDSSSLPAAMMSSNAADKDSVADRGGGGFTPIVLPPDSFAALARLLRASLDQAASNREFLQARNCLVTSGLYTVRGSEYVAWLRAAEAGGGGNSGGGGGGGGSSGSGSGGDVLAVMADSELVSAAGELDRQKQLDRDGGGGGGGGGAEDKAGVGDGSGGEERKDGEVKGKGLDGTTSGAEAAGANYLLQRELRRHPIWRTIELWEVAMSDSVVMAADGGGARAERWLPAGTLVALDEVRRGYVLGGKRYHCIFV